MGGGDSGERFRALDGLRGLFALALALFHLGLRCHLVDRAPARASFLFVDFFFVLSGFVISHATAGGLATPRAASAFVIRRFGRVWPLHVLVLGCLVAGEILKLALTHASGVAPKVAAFDPSRSTSLVSIPANVAMMQALHLFPIDTWNEPSWSISTEFYTYVLFALLSLAAARRLSWLAALIVVTGEAMLWTWATSIDVTHDLGFVRCAIGFFTGHLVYRVWTRSRAVKTPALAEPVCLVLAVVFMSLAMGGRLSLGAPLVFAACVWIFAHEAGPLSRVLRTRVFQALGRWSYAIYMVHFFVVVNFYRLVAAAEKVAHRPLRTTVPALSSPGNASDLVDLGNRWVMDGLALAYLGVVVVVAAAATRFVETPTRAWFNARARALAIAPQPAPRSVEPA